MSEEPAKVNLDARSSARSNEGLASRLAAAEILYRVDQESAYADVLLGGRLPDFAPADRRLITRLVLGTLAWQRTPRLRVGASDGTQARRDSARGAGDYADGAFSASISRSDSAACGGGYRRQHGQTNSGGAQGVGLRQRRDAPRDARDGADAGARAQRKEFSRRCVFASALDGRAIRRLVRRRECRAPDDGEQRRRAQRDQAESRARIPRGDSREAERGRLRDWRVRPRARDGRARRCAAFRVACVSRGPVPRAIRGVADGRANARRPRGRDGGGLCGGAGRQGDPSCGTRRRTRTSDRSGHQSRRTKERARPGAPPAASECRVCLRRPDGCDAACAGELRVCAAGRAVHGNRDLAGASGDQVAAQA